MYVAGGLSTRMKAQKKENKLSTMSLCDAGIVTCMHAHDVKLIGETEFIKSFNYVSELFQIWKDSTGTEEEKKILFDNFFDAKYRMECGY